MSRRAWKPSQEQLDELNAMLLLRLKALQKKLHDQLVALEMAGQGLPLLTGKERADMIRESRRLVRRSPVGAQVIAAKLLLNAQCPGWEVEAPDLAHLIAGKVPPDCDWADLPLGVVSWH